MRITSATTSRRKINQRKSLPHAITGRALTLALGIACILVVSAPAFAADAVSPACEKLQAKYPQFKGKTLVDAVNPHTPGYEALDPQDPSKYIGFDIDLVQALGQCLGFGVTYKSVTFAALLTTLSSGQADIVISDIYATKERAKAADFITYSKVFDGVLVVKDNPKHITGINTTMCGDAAAENTGYVEVPLLQALAEPCKAEGKAAPTIQLYDNNADCIQAILAGRADTYVNDVNTVDQAVKAYPDKLGKATAVTLPYSVGIAVPKDKPEFRDAILAALIEISGHRRRTRHAEKMVTQLRHPRGSASPDRVMNLFLHYLTLPYLRDGIIFTLEVTGLGLLGGLGVGLLLAAMQLSRFRPLAAFARAYAVIFRGTPLILQLVFAYDALPHIGLKLSSVAAAGLALAANEGPFIAEILRSGVLGVDAGQILAGQALGMTPLVLMRRIIAPQAIRTMVPGLGNETVSALKNSSLASVIAVEELTLRSTQLASSTFDFFSIFFASGLMYLALTGAVSGLQLSIEAMLDLDRPKPREMWRRLLPWYRRPPIAHRPKDLPPPEPTKPMASFARTARAKSLADAPVSVEVRDLCKRYGDQVVLSGLDLTIRSGEVIALLGPSGAGKSTLLRCINLLEGWDGGTVKISGRRLGYREDGQKLSARDLARSAPPKASAWYSSSSTCSAT